MGGSQRATTHTDKAPIGKPKKKAPGFPFSIQTLNPSTAMWSPDPTLRSLESSRIEILPPPLNSPADLIRNRPRGLHMEERTTAGGRAGEGTRLPSLFSGPGTGRGHPRAATCTELPLVRVCTSCSGAQAGDGRREEEAGLGYSNDEAKGSLSKVPHMYPLPAERVTRLPCRPVSRQFHFHFHGTGVSLRDPITSRNHQG